MHSLGNIDLLKLHKVAFLCSRSFPSRVLTRAQLWADRQREQGICVISGYHSPIEKEVLHRLLPGGQPIVIALASGLGRVASEWRKPIEDGRLLVITRYADSVTHADQSKCLQRNRLMLELANEIVIAHASPGGNLERLCREYQHKQLSWLWPTASGTVIPDVPGGLADMPSDSKEGDRYARTDSDLHDQ